MRNTQLFFSFIVLFLAACTPPPVEETLVDDSAQKEADIQAINNVNELWDAAALAEDMDGILALVTDDYISWESGQPTIVGKEALRNAFQPFWDKYRIENLKNVSDEIRLAGDWAYVRGSWTGTIVPKAGGGANTTLR
jgi:ketosteroid isomerase-like protein